MSDEAEPVTQDVPFSVLGIRMPEDQRAKIREAARIEERTESSFARYHLTKIAEAIIAAAQPKPEKVA